MSRWLRRQFSTPWVRVLALCFVGVVVGSVGLAYRDWRGIERPCVLCGQECQVRATDEVPLHEMCRLPYQDSQIKGWSVTVTATREDRMATKTQVTDEGATIIGKLGVYSQTEYPILISAPTKFCHFWAGGVLLAISDISTSGWDGPDPQPNPPWGTELTFAIYIDLAPAGTAGSLTTLAHEFVYVTDASDDDIERTFSLSITGQRLWREESTSYGAGRDGKPVFAREVTETDQWIGIDPVHVEVSLGSLSCSFNRLLIELPPVAPISGMIVYFDQHKGASWIKYAAAIDLKWSAVNVNFSGMSKTYGAAPPGVGGKVTGGLGSLELTYNDTAQRTSSWLHGLPLMPDFSFVSIRNRQGILLPDVRLSGPWVASLEVPDSLNWSMVP